MNEANATLAQQRLQIAFEFAIPFGIVTVIVSILGGFATAAFGAAIGVALAVSLLGLIAGVVVIGYEMLIGLDESSRIIVESAIENVQQLAAQRLAIERATGGQIAIASGGSTIKQQFKSAPTVYRVNGQVVNGNQLKLNQINQTEPRRIEIPAADVRWFAEQLANGYGHSKSKWVIAKVELPYSRLPVDWTIYKALVDPLAEGGAIVGRGERSAGRLVMTDPAQLVKVIEQRHPDAGSKGIVLELPAEASASTG